MPPPRSTLIMRRRLIPIVLLHGVFMIVAATHSSSTFSSHHTPWVAFLDTPVSISSTGHSERRKQGTAHLLQVLVRPCAAESPKKPRILLCRMPCSSPTRAEVLLCASSSEAEPPGQQPPAPPPPPPQPSCYYRSPKTGKWRERRALGDLDVGQLLNDCRVVQELLEGRTGPKLFCECGVGRIGSNGKWEIVHALLRLGDRKASVARKRAARLRQKLCFEAYVSRIRQANGRLEVSLEDPKDAPATFLVPAKVPASRLRPGQEVVGTVVRVEPYGVLVDVNATRRGLLPIQAVADLYGRYIPQAKGLAEAGLSRGSRVRLQVASNERQRLALDFPDDVKRVAAAELAERQREQSDGRRYPPEDTRRPAVVPGAQPSRPIDVQAVGPTSHSKDAADDDREDEYAADDDEADDYDDYDEDREIEDALGLGTY